LGRLLREADAIRLIMKLKNVKFYFNF
jgi:hypothetical protein